MTVIRVVESWVEEPLRRFVSDSRARLALLLHPSGQVVGQYGFHGAMEVMSAAALASAIYASAGKLGEALDGRAFTEMHHGGGERHIYLAHAGGAGAAFVLLVVFGRESSLGLVRLYRQALSVALDHAAPPLPVAPAFAEDFEHELRRSLSLLFGGDTPPATPAIHHSA